jgi:hypothetical protein
MNHPTETEEKPSSYSDHRTETLRTWDLGQKSTEAFSISAVAPIDLKNKLDHILKPYRTGAEEFLSILDQALWEESGRFWAIILFERELPKSGHFMKILDQSEHLIMNRNNSEHIKGFRYLQRCGTEDTAYFPCLGGLVLQEKFDSEEPGDRFLHLIWRVIKPLDPHRRWCVLASASDEAWIADHALRYEMKTGDDWNGMYYQPKIVWDGSPGLEALAYLYGSSLNVDDAWSMKGLKKFAWWHHEHRQTIWVAKEVQDDDITLYEVNVTTDFIRGSSASVESILEAMVELAPRLSGSSTPVYDPKDKSVHLCTSCWVHEGNVDWLKRDLGIFAALQITDAVLLADSFSKEVRGFPDRSRHPVQGTRIKPDRKLKAYDVVLEPTSGFINNWCIPPVLLGAIDLFDRSGYPVSWHRTGVSALLGFDGERTTCLEVSCTSHHELGLGCWINLELPIIGRLARTAGLANWLNFNELQGSVLSGLMGGWTAESTTEANLARLKYKMFLPNFLYGQGKLENYILYMLRRSQWVSKISKTLDSFMRELTLPPKHLDIPDQKQRTSAISVKVDVDFGLRKGILVKRGDIFDLTD